MSKVKETCIQAACFFLPFFENGEWRTKGKSPWKTVREGEMTPERLRELGEYTEHRLNRNAEVMEFLMSIHDQWSVVTKKDGVFLETTTMDYEDSLPKLQAAGFTRDDFVLYSEYTRKWGMI